MIPPILCLLLLWGSRLAVPYISVGLASLGGLAAGIGFIACLVSLRGMERLGHAAACVVAFALLFSIVLAELASA